jgi:hypothetical protein
LLGGGVADRVGPGDDLVSIVEAVRRGAAGCVGENGDVVVVVEGAVEETAGALVGDASTRAVAVEVDPVVVAVGDRDQRGDLVGAGEVESAAGASLRDGEAGVGAGQRPARTQFWWHRIRVGRVRIDQDHAVFGDEHDALLVELQPLVHSGRPARPERPARAVTGDVGATQHQRQDARQFDVDVGEHHVTADDVDQP